MTKMREEHMGLNHSYPKKGMKYPQNGRVHKRDSCGGSRCGACRELTLVTLNNTVPWRNPHTFWDDPLDSLPDIETDGQ